MTRTFNSSVLLSISLVLLACSSESDPGPRLQQILINGIPSQVILGVTSSIQLTAQGIDQNSKPFVAEFTWASSDNSRASVSNSGLVAILTAGEVFITAEAKGVSESVSITILPPSVLTKITITGVPAQVIAGLMPSVEVHAIALDQYNRKRSVAAFNWSSSDEAKATVNADGQVRILKTGSVSIRAESAGVVGILTFTIQPKPAFEIFVSSRGTNSVKRYNGDNGQFIDDFVLPNSGGLSVTQEVAFGPDGHLYVSGRGNSAIKKYDGTTGAFIGNFTSGYTLDEPTKMTFGPDGKLYVSQWGKSKNKVTRFNSLSGEFIDEITGGLSQGMSHAWDKSGNLYIVSYGSRDVKIYDAAGAFVKVFTSGGDLQGPVNMWFGQNENLYVVDWETGSVQIFDGSTGVFIQNFITGLTRTEGFSFDPQGNLYLCDWTQNIVNKYNGVTGTYISTFINSGGLSQPNGVAIR